MLAYMLTLGNVETQVPVCSLSKNISGIMFADKGCSISHPLFIQLYNKSLEIITGSRKNMKNKLMSRG
jgi:hypothetical protein